MRDTKGKRVETVWKLTRWMWGDIADEAEKDDDLNIRNAKKAWCKKHGYWLESDCFFCDWCGTRYNVTCDSCPGKEIDLEFSCMDEPSWYEDPIGFYERICEMDDKRLEMKRKARRK